MINPDSGRLPLRQAHGDPYWMVRSATLYGNSGGTVGRMPGPRHSGNQGQEQVLDVAFVLYEGMTALDLVGPADVLAHLPGVQASYVATDARPVRADNGMVLTPSTTFDAIGPCDVIVVPGSGTPTRALDNTALVGWLRSAHPQATWTTSVCTGASLLAEAGILQGRTATTHWAFRHLLADRGVNVSVDRVVRDGDVITAAGVSAGIDMALALTGLVFGDDVAQLAQLAIEYDPQPPYTTGSAATAPPQLVGAAQSLLLAGDSATTGHP